MEKTVQQFCFFFVFVLLFRCHQCFLMDSTRTTLNVQHRKQSKKNENKWNKAKATWWNTQRIRIDLNNYGLWFQCVLSTVVVIMWPLAPLRLVGWCCQSSQDCYQTTPHPTNAMVIPLILNSLFCDTKHISINPHQSMFRLFPFFLATLNLGMKATSWACVISLMKVTKHSASLMPRRTRICFFFQGSAHKHLSGWKLKNVCLYIRQET